MSGFRTAVMPPRVLSRGLAVALALAAGVACGKSQDLYRSCDGPEDCVAPEGATPVCLIKADGGFCTWACDSHADCNEADDDDFNFWCAPFESSGGTYCFPGCEGAEDGDCPDEMSCRSTGGGSNNVQVCFPNDA